MINRQALLADLQKFLHRIEADLLERSESMEVPEVPAALHAEYEKAAKAERTSQNYEDWRTDTITQAAAAWVLSGVFVRFLEDNSLIDPPKIAGPGERLARARDEHELYFRSHPQHTDREYLLSIFGELAKLPGTRDIFGEHNAINDLPNWLSGDAAGELLNFFQKIDASSGVLVHNFTDPAWDTRFLGDLYQDLSEAARKKFALLQTPDFVEEFILDRTLDPAVEEFGLVPQPSPTDPQSPTHFKMIDPACGSGHFLLGAFPRLLDRWQRKEPGTNIRELTQRALDSIHGVDINPFAVAVAKFRLLLVAMKTCEIRQLSDAPGFHINVACGDSLLHGENRTSSGQKLWDYADGATDEELYSHAYPGEDLKIVRELLKPNSYHCVVANPPYIVPKDRKLADWYRKRFTACHMQYSLAVPFMQQIYQLASKGGFTGQITANSFMKREFGKRLVESFFSSIDLTHVVDTSGAYIPGHGTPTTILFGRNREFSSSKLRTVLGIRGEPATPGIPSQGFVWQAIVGSIDQPGKQTEFVSVNDSDRSLFHKHPWAIGGGGAAELKEHLEKSKKHFLDEFSTAIGRTASTQGDDVFVSQEEVFRRQQLQRNAFKRFVSGDEVRDWTIADGDCLAFPYDEQGKPIEDCLDHPVLRFLWCSKPTLSNTMMFGGKTKVEVGMKWFEYGQWLPHRFVEPLSITYAEVATHNHFVLDRGEKVFNRTAPVIKLPATASEVIHLALLGLLNSSTTCFWMKQVAHQKQMMGGDGIRIESKAKVPYAFSGTQLGKLPIPESWGEGPLRDRLIELARLLDSLSTELTELTPSSKILTGRLGAHEMRIGWEALQDRIKFIRSKMIHLQEEIDFTVYVMWGLADTDVLSRNEWVDDVVISEGERPFDILRGRNEDGFPVPNGIPSEWPQGMRDLWQQRMDVIQRVSEIKLIEDPHYKRRWIGRQGLFNHTKNKGDLERACEQWLLLRFETYFDFDGRMTDELLGNNRPGILSEIAAYSVAQLADAARRDPQFMDVGELYRDDPAFDVQALVEELVLAESVPHLPILRYKDSGLRKRAEWEKTWDLQREEDRLDALRAVVLQELGDAQERVRATFTAEWAELEQKRAQLLELTAQAYRESNKEIPAFDPDQPAEVHANALLRDFGRKSLVLAAAIDSAMIEISDYKTAVEARIKAACNEDPAVRAARSHLQEIPPPPKIPVPPKYTSADFISTGGARYWALRGKLDVPKERWISFPHCEGPDGTLTICWAGYDHLQQAQAISSYYVRVQTEFGGSDDPRLVPLLASLTELLPWLKQWHNDPNPNFDGLRMGDYFEGFVNEEARNLGKTLDEIKAWVPPKKLAKAKATKSKKKSAQEKVEAEE